ncbi:MAG: glutathione S-transferase N-terminal domain-containing protein [Casimicrobiaceae bacterium]|nr:glutathione S-transferase N-terminal domain-containing protein [Casimicrobiaceae bacterium]MCX8099356.1 glutathione S-transferase N-terminal domain-containing protein [Casimicrobiaceae bacterium]MDW8311984.1 glutathione S-transferase N-terminal domain-containing protein [Burkholderiales bacterium]
MPKLLYSPTSPYARKVRIVAAEKKIELELVPTDPWRDAAELLHANPLGKVPTLVLDDGLTLFDSRVIVEYLDHVSPVHRLLSEDNRERLLIRRWEALADGVCDAAVLARLESLRPDQTASSLAQIERQRGKIVSALDFMEAELNGREHCIGRAFTLADIAVGVALGYLDLRLADLAWHRSRPNLARLYQKLQQRPSFAATLPPASS